MSTINPAKLRIANLISESGIPLKSIAQWDTETLEKLNTQYLNIFGPVNAKKKWTENQILQRIYFFYKAEGRWPNAKDFRAKNGMPTEVMIARTFKWMRSDKWNRWIDADKIRAHPTLVKIRSAISPTVGAPAIWWNTFDAAIALTYEKYKDKLSTKSILSIRNVTHRRYLLDSIGGVDALVAEGLAKEIQKDDFGTLWQLPGETEQTKALYVEVENKTPEPDGSYAHYFLRVPPETATAKAGVAWTFNKNPATFKGWEVET